MSDFYDYIKSPDLWKKSGKRIQERRKEKGITSQGQLADLIGVERRLPGEWEIGKHHIKSTADLAALARILEVDPEYITCQIDTYRAEHADAAAKYGLSEETLSFLSESQQDYAAFPYNPAARSLDILIGNEPLFTSFMDMIIAEKSAALPDPPKDPSEFESFNLGEDTFIIGPKFPSHNEHGLTYITNRQAAFISEQEFIFILRKVLE